LVDSLNLRLKVTSVIDFLLIAAGFAILIYGADTFVNGASSLALILKIPNIVIGLTIVAFGTSSPELAVNIAASLDHQSEITMGNILGSNIINIAVILGIASLIKPLEIRRNTTRIEIPLAVLSSLVIFVMGNDFIFDNVDAVISRSEGLVLLQFFSVFLVYSILISLSGKPEESDFKKYSIFKSIFYFTAGLVMIIVSGKIIVDSTVSLAVNFGIPERIISLTVIALGTSLPELATSVVAAKKGNVDLAVGNVVGSCLFNAFFVLGVSAAIYPVTVVDQNQFDFLINVLVSLLLYIFIFTGEGRNINKWEGISFLVVYSIYLVLLIVQK
jgi:cation:H+ antiporter